MDKNFWTQLKKPFFVLAPMADVTDAAFRRLIAKYGKPDVTWTEFVSADGLAHPDAKEKLLKDLAYSEEERPIVAQIFSGNPENIEQAAALVRELGFDGVDINMGCPDKSVEKQGAGANLIKDPKRAREIIRAAKRGAGDMPVSIKTRIGYNKNEVDTWIPELLAEEPAALTVHLRTRKEMSKVDAHWDLMPEVVALAKGTNTRILGNGDAISLEDARKKAEESGADGVMIGRGIFGNPWCFNPDVKKENIPLAEQLRVMVEHTKLFEELCPHKNFAVMKKHYKAYAHGFDGAKELRIKLMETENATEVEQITNEFLKTLS